MLMMDSVTRFALSERASLSIGEPANSGYTPSVFALLPKLFEEQGLINMDQSLLFTCFSSGDLDEPVADAVRGLLDGHIVLDRELAHRDISQYPVLSSASRLIMEIMTRNISLLNQVERVNCLI